MAGAGITLDQTVRVRFAPSPTGTLHIGSARTALYNFLFARHTGGSFVLRIDDTDAARSDAALEASIMADLRWLGLGVGRGAGPRRSLRPLPAERAARAAPRRGRASCWRRGSPTAASARGAPRGSCAARRSPPDARRGTTAAAWRLRPTRCERRLAAGEPAAVRFKVPAGDVVVDDLIRGHVVIGADALGDPIIVRSDGVAGYNFATVVDDRDMAHHARHPRRRPPHQHRPPAAAVRGPRRARAALRPPLHGPRARRRQAQQAPRRHRGRRLPRPRLPARGDRELPGAARLVARRGRGARHGPARRRVRAREALAEPGRLRPRPSSTGSTTSASWRSRRRSTSAASRSGCRPGRRRRRRPRSRPPSSRRWCATATRRPLSAEVLAPPPPPPELRAAALAAAPQLAHVRALRAEAAGLARARRRPRPPRRLPRLGQGARHRRPRPAHAAAHRAHRPPSTGPSCPSCSPRSTARPPSRDSTTSSPGTLPASPRRRQETSRDPPLQLADPAEGALRAPRPRQGRRLLLRPHGLQPGAHRQRAALRHLRRPARRGCASRGLDVTLVTNITDVDDKIINKANAEGRDPAAVAEEFTAAYVEDTDRLGIPRPDIEPKATETIAEIIDLVCQLIDSDHAYPAQRQRLLPRAQLRRLRQAQQAAHRRARGGRPRRHRARQAGSPRFRPLEGRQARRHAGRRRLGHALGSRPPRLAH